MPSEFKYKMGVGEKAFLTVCALIIPVVFFVISIRALLQQRERARMRAQGTVGVSAAEPDAEGTIPTAVDPNSSGNAVALPGSGPLTSTQGVYEPKDRMLFSVPVSSLDPTWERASLLTYDMLPQSARTQFSSPETVRFKLDLDIDHDGSAERFLVGVYASSSGEKGRFLIVLKPSGGQFKVMELFKNAGEPGFSCLNEQKGSVSWVFSVGPSDDYVDLAYENGKIVMVEEEYE